MRVESPEDGALGGLEPIRPPCRLRSFTHAPIIRKDCYDTISVCKREVHRLNEVIEATGPFASGFANLPEVLTSPRTRVAIYPLDSRIIHALYLPCSPSAPKRRAQSSLGVCYCMDDGKGGMVLGRARLVLFERNVFLGSTSPSPKGPGFLFDQETAQQIVRGISELLKGKRTVEVKLQTRQDINGRWVWGNIPGTRWVFPSLLDFARCPSFNQGTSIFPP